MDVCSCRLGLLREVDINTLRFHKLQPQDRRRLFMGQIDFSLQMMAYAAEPYFP